MEIPDNQDFAQNQTATPLPVLDEDFIKKNFAPFLRDFYKYRYAVVPGTVQTSFDNVSEEGLIADGKLTFLKKDDPEAERREYFTCTFEATSREKSGEVKFSLNLPYLVWDSTGFAAICTLLTYVVCFFREQELLVSFGTAGNVGMVFGLMVMYFTCWFFLMRPWKKYRYIFAIEQFKRYFADEQWIALAEDVFPNPADPFLAELKNQCVFNGFGLAVVGSNGQTSVYATPSRLGIYGRDRKMTDWITDSKLYKAASQGSLKMVGQVREKTPGFVAQLFGQIWKPIDFYVYQPIKNQLWRVLSTPFGRTASVYNRFMGGQTTQKTMTIFSAIVLAYFVHKIMIAKDSGFADEDTYRSELDEKLAFQDNPEDYRGYVVDDAAPKYGSIPKQYPETESMEDEDDGIATINLSGEEEDEESKDEIGAKPEIEETQQVAAPKNVEPKTSPKPSAATAKDPCAMVAGKKGWLVQDGYFSDKTFAETRLGELKHRGIKCFVVWKGCLEKGGTGYFVFIGEVYGSEKTGRAELENFQKALKRYSLERGRLILRKR